MKAPARGPIDATVKGSVDLKALADSGLLVNYRMAGRLDADLRLVGSAAAPRAQGSIKLENGRFEDAGTGTVLDKIRLEIRGAGRRIEIARGEASDSEKGTLKLTGAVDLDVPKAIHFASTSSPIG